MPNTATKIEKRKLRHSRVRAKIIGTKKRPRVSVFRSARHIYTQIINDEEARTILNMNDNNLSEKDRKEKNKTEIAFLVGKNLGKAAKELGVKNVVFDRGGFMYHGRVRAIADGLREAGIKI